jgi:hypothetical protein
MPQPDEAAFGHVKQGPKITYSREGMKIDCSGATMLEVQIPWEQIRQMQQRFDGGAK